MREEVTSKSTSIPLSGSHPLSLEEIRQYQAKGKLLNYPFPFRIEEKEKENDVIKNFDPYY